MNEQFRWDTDDYVRHTYSQKIMGVKIMRNPLAIFLLAFSSLWIGSGSIPCVAAEAKNPGAVTPDAKLPQHTRNKMHKPSQRKIPHPSQREMHRTQKSNEKRQHDAKEPVQMRSEGAPSPSQRSMRQKLKKANPIPAPETGNPEPR